MCTRDGLYHSLLPGTTLIGTLILFGLILVLPAWADYQRTGPVTGTVCTGFGIEVCDANVSIVAVKEDGRLYHVTETFKSVDDYNTSTGMCHVRLKHGMWTPLNWLIGKLKNPDF
ncbi:MAG: hypothetical protein OXF97_08960 [Nitrospira sp.]|nr:hypothetical protein [Nitrospira sp.]